MAKSEAAMLHEFEGVRTGKANPALVENIMVDAYGSSMRLRDMAGITAPETRMILIQPWDAGTVESISKAIQAANLGLNPAIDGKVIRIINADDQTIRERVLLNLKTSQPFEEVR